MSSVPPYVVLYKKRGETPLETITAWKAVHPEYAALPASYAGRLDPMAQGKLLVLLGEECKRQEAYRGLDKEYRIELVLDMSSDTGDVLGMGNYAERVTDVSGKDISQSLHALTGSHIVPYPIFSSKTVHGKPLFLHTLEGTLDSIQIPQHIETIYKIQLDSFSDVPRDDLYARIMHGLSIVPETKSVSMELGQNFRIEKVRNTWKSMFQDIPERSFLVLSMRITCASGTYMRTFADRLGSKLGTLATILSIDRTKIGTYRSLGVFSHWQKEY